MRNENVNAQIDVIDNLITMSLKNKYEDIL
jgi:hypothetical protein